MPTNVNELIAYIQQYIYANGQGLITGPRLAAVLVAIVTYFGTYYAPLSSPSFTGTVTINGAPIAGSVAAVVNVFNYMTNEQIADFVSGGCSVNMQSAFQAALADLPGAKGTVVVPAGTACLSSPIVLSTGQFIVGQGQKATTIKSLAGTCTVLVTTANYNSLVNTGTVGGPYKFGLKELTLDGNKANVSGACDNADIYGYDYVLENVMTQNSPGIGWFTQWSQSGAVPVASGGDGMEAHVSHFKAYNNAGWGIMWQGPHDSVLTDIEASNNITGGFACNSAANYVCVLAMTQFHAYANHGYGLQEVASTITGANLISETNFGDNIYVDASSILFGTNFQVYNCNATGCAGLHLNGPSSIVSNIRANNNLGPGVFVSGAGNKLTDLQTFSNGNGGIVTASNSNFIQGVQSYSNTGTGVFFSGTSNVLIGAISVGNTTNYNNGTGNNTVNEF